MEQEKSTFYSELAIASLTMGVLCFIQLFGLERSIAAIVFGILALKRIKQDETLRGKKLAIAGIVLGAIYSLIAIAIIPQAIETVKKMISTAQ
ncbi:MAG: DUF4190 domain-containing protein [Candidatus Omnitrophota bacterium]